MKEIKALIEGKIEDLSKQISYQIHQGIPLAALYPIQHEIFALQWVLDEIEKCTEAKICEKI